MQVESERDGDMRRNNDWDLERNSTGSHRRNSRNRKNNLRKERIIMTASSALVLAAMTMTGVYMKDKESKAKDDGYSIDFTSLENNVDDKYEEINSDDLDYMPMEVDSGLVEIPGLTDGKYHQQDQNGNDTGDRDGNREDAAEGESSAGDGKSMDNGELDQDNTDSPDAGKEAYGENGPDDVETADNQVKAVNQYHFAETDGLARPCQGEVLMPYSMDSSIYFATLDQYKYNPAMVFSAEEGSKVTACAEGKVAKVYEDSKLGQVVCVDLGNGYQATYGQLKDLQVKKGSTLREGDLIGSVAAPTKYYSVEGSNLYFQFSKDGEPMNPEPLFR